MDKQEKLAMQTSNLADDNFAALAAMFPNAVTETITGHDENGEPITDRAIDADVLAQEINTHVVSGKEERYQFTWPDKKKSVLLANAPIAATLRPCREESVDFDNTENLYIEGDNLDVLKLLRETYLNRVKMVYIDPPYNTGNDFIYEDNFTGDRGEFLERDGQYDEDRNRMVKNLDGNGRFHTDWLNMIYPRLRVARDLLADDGVIFISIGQAELANQIKICNEIWGENNCLGIISRQMKSGGGSQGKYFSHNIDYIIVYAKIYDVARYFRGGISEELSQKVYNQIEKEGKRKGEFYRSMGLYQSSLGVRPSLRYWIQCPDGTLVIPPGETFPEKIQEGEKINPISTDGVWRWSYEKYIEEKEKGNIEFKETSNGVLVSVDGRPSKWNVYTKIWLKDRQSEGQIPSDIITKYENRHSSKELSSLKIPFDFPKPSELVKYLISISQIDKDAIIMDFFSGSATTAHAVMKLNAEDEGNRKFIMVQIPEETDEKSEAYKAGFQNICEIGKERIRRAGVNIKEETGLVAQNLDTGFRVLKLDSSNMKEVYYTPEEYSQIGFNLEGFMDNIKPDRSDEDLLFQVMLDLGIPLSAKIEQDGEIFNVNDNYLIACFGIVDTTMITDIAQKQPYYAVFRDSSFANDSALVNVEQVFNTYSPSTIRRVL